MCELEEAFNQLADFNGEIRLLEIFKSMEEDDIKGREKLVYDVLRRITNFSEVCANDRIDFCQFVGLIKKAMNMRQTKQQVDLLFNLFDP